MRAKLAGFTMAIGLLATAGPGCGGSDEAEPEPGEVPASAPVVGLAVAEGAGLAAALAAPFATVMIEVDETTSEAAYASEVELAVAASGLTADSTCLSFDWQDLALTVTFESCVLGATGLTVDGSLTVALSASPPWVSVSFESLAVGSAMLDGTVVLGREDGATYVTADLTITTGDGATIVLEGVTVESGSEGVTLDGAASVTSASVDAELTFEAVTWAPGDCLPSGGSVVYDDGGPLLTTITFLPTTPDDGVVLVAVGPLPATEVALLEPCETP